MCVSTNVIQSFLEDWSFEPDYTLRYKLLRYRNKLFTYAMIIVRQQQIIFSVNEM